LKIDLSFVCLTRAPGQKRRKSKKASGNYKLIVEKKERSSHLDLSRL